MEHEILFSETKIPQLVPLRLDHYDDALHKFTLMCKLDRDSPYCNGGRYDDDFEEKFERYVGIKKKNFIVISKTSPLYEKCMDIWRSDFHQYLAFIGKTFEEHMEDERQEYWRIRGECPDIEASTARYSREKEEFYQKRDEEETIAELAAWSGKGTWRYPIWLFRYYAWEPLRVKIICRLIFPIQLIFSRKERERWTSIANFHKEFEQAEYELFQGRWEREREQLQALNQMVNTTIQSSCARYH